MNTKQLEQEYDHTKELIKQNLNLIKTYVSNIEDCKKQIDKLGIRLSEIQTQYLELTKENKDHQNEQP